MSAQRSDAASPAPNIDTFALGVATRIVERIDRFLPGGACQRKAIIQVEVTRALQQWRPLPESP